MESKTFADYLCESEKEYKYTLKFACEKVDDDMLDKLEDCLTKYDIRSASAFKDTPIQESPLDFPNVKYSKVYISEIVVGYPVTSDMLRQYLSQHIGLSEQNIAVYGENDPRAIYTAEYLERTSPDFKEKYQAKIGTDPDDIQEKAAYGEEAVSNFLKDLEASRKERKASEYTVIDNKLMYAQEEDNSSVSPEEKGKQNNKSLFGR